MLSYMLSRADLHVSLCALYLVFMVVATLSQTANLFHLSPYLRAARVLPVPDSVLTNTRLVLPVKGCQ